MRCEQNDMSDVWRVRATGPVGEGKVINWGPEQQCPCCDFLSNIFTCFSMTYMCGSKPNTAKCVKSPFLSWARVLSSVV